jgi:hypothetical protein
MWRHSGLSTSVPFSSISILLYSLWIRLNMDFWMDSIRQSRGGKSERCWLFNFLSITSDSAMCSIYKFSTIKNIVHPCNCHVYYVYRFLINSKIFHACSLAPLEFLAWIKLYPFMKLLVNFYYLSVSICEVTCEFLLKVKNFWYPFRDFQPNTAILSSYIHEI